MTNPRKFDSKLTLTQQGGFTKGTKIHQFHCSSAHPWQCFSPNVYWDNFRGGQDNFPQECWPQNFCFRGAKSQTFYKRPDSPPELPDQVCPNVFFEILQDIGQWKSERKLDSCIKLTQQGDFKKDKISHFIIILCCFIMFPNFVFIIISCYFIFHPNIVTKCSKSLWIHQHAD